MEEPAELRLKFPFREPDYIWVFFFSLTRKERQKPAQLAKEKLVCWKIDFVPHLSFTKLTQNQARI